MSLSSVYLKPPVRYTSALLESNRTETLGLMQKHWTMLLDAEQQQSGGRQIPMLDLMHWRNANVVRLTYLGNDFWSNQMCNVAVGNPALHMLRLAVNHYGDTSVIENTHNCAKDSLRDARHNQKASTSKFHAVISSTALKARDIEGIKVTDAQKVGASSCSAAAFNRLTHPNTHVPWLLYSVYFRTSR